jgi:hypothetical protein
VVVYRDRTYAGLPIPHSNDGTSPRPLLAPYRTQLTAHYPGSPLGRSYAEMAGDVKKKTYVHAVQRSALANGKSFEYNYFVFMDGEVWEYAGDFLAAHSAGENADAYGVQFVNGQDDLCTDAQVTAYQWLRDIHLKSRQRVTMTAATIPHREMPGAATACPGPRAVMPRLADLRKPYLPVQPPPPEPEPVEDDDDMLTFIAQIPDGRFLLVGTTIRVLSRAELDMPPYAGLPVTKIPPTNDAANDYREYWYTKAADEYTKRIEAA